MVSEISQTAVQFWKYAMVGISGTIVTLTTTFVIVGISSATLGFVSIDIFQIVFPIILSIGMTIGWSAGTISNFILNRIITFEKPPGNIFWQFTKYWLSTLVALFFWQVTTFMLVYLLQIWWVISSILAVAVSTIVGFIMAKWFTFQPDPIERALSSLLISIRGKNEFKKGKITENMEEQ